jgi:thioredoxin 1
MISIRNPEQIANAIATGSVVVVKFGASWCGPCQILAPHVHHLAQEFEPQGVIFFDVDVKGEELTEYAIENGARTVPYTQIYVKGSLLGFVKGNQPDGIRNGILAALSHQ